MVYTVGELTSARSFQWRPESFQARVQHAEFQTVNRATGERTGIVNAATSVKYPGCRASHFHWKKRLEAMYCGRFDFGDRRGSHGYPGAPARRYQGRRSGLRDLRKARAFAFAFARGVYKEMKLRPADRTDVRFGA